VRARRSSSGGRWAAHTARLRYGLPGKDEPALTASKTEFKRRLDRALGSDRLRTALGRALPELKERRDARMREIDWVGLRADLTERKAKAVDDMPELVERFTREAEAVGAKVYRAVDAEEARRIVTAICRAKKAKLVVKSKSMATEEIGLTDHLESQGIHAVETDLGEWIIQLAGERPSHLIAPAIHKTREEVAALFSKVVGHPVADDVASLVAVARKELRQSFIDADIGITGGNALIADTGTLMLVTNEGNADLATTLPAVHIAVVGIEKIVPTIDDAVAIVKLLARSGTGQKITSYTQFITGPSRSADIELKTQIGVHGPKELHFVLLDNGRMAMRDDPFARDALRCIRCGACSNVCPSYQEVGGHVFGHIYTGPIGLVVSPWHHGIESVAHEQALCMGCNACDTVCPVGIPLASLITDVRAQAVERTGMSWAKRLFMRQWSTPDRIDRLTGWLATFQNPLRRNGSVRLPFGSLAQEGLDRIAADRIVIPSSSCAITIAQDYARILSDDPVWADRARKLAERVTAFTPFVASIFRERPLRGRRLGLRATYHDACQSANVLGIHQDPRTLLREVAGVEIVEMAESAVCCGFGGSFSFEYPEVANRVLERKLANIEATGVDLVIADNPGCLTHLRGAMDAREKATRIRHIAEVLWESLG
jgi:iron-sulfur cluster protein